MNILHVLSQFEVTGAETFAATLANEQIKNGHTVYIVSDTFQSKTNATVVSHPIGKRDLSQRLNNISFLKQFIREHDIDVVDAHSRAASWVSYFATRKGRVPLVSHIHAQQHIHFSSKTFPVYGEKRIAVCKTIYKHLNVDLKYSIETLSLVKNGIDLECWTYRPHRRNVSGKKIVTYVGRLSGFKGDTLLKLIEETFPKVLEKFPSVEIHIIGGMSEQSKILPTIQKVNELVGKEFILPKGFSINVQEVYHSADVIIGSGRVAMEALACGATVIAVGESNYVGILSEKSKDIALETNFGDLDKRHPIDTNATAKDIITALENNLTTDEKWGRQFVEKEFDISVVAEKLDRVYAEACAVKRGAFEVPVLLYHQVSNKPGEVTTISPIEFEHQLIFLKKKKITPLTFSELKEIIYFKKHIPLSPIILTFDGTDENFRHAFPLLQKFNMKGVFFVKTGVGIEPLQLSKLQMKELVTKGYEIGSATVSGKKFNIMSEDEIGMEVNDSIQMLEDSIALPVISFEYPHGFVNEKSKSIVSMANILFAVSIDEGRRNFWSDLLKIKRIQIFAGASKFSFWKKTSGYYHWYKNVY